MLKPVDHAAMPACGYVSAWNVRAGDTVTLHASSLDPGADLGVRRLDRPLDVLDWRICPGAEPLAHRNIDRGSWVQIDGLRLDPGTTLEIECLITRNATPRTLLSWGEISLFIDPDRVLTLASATDAASSSADLPSQHWLTLRLARTDDAIEVLGLATGARRDPMSLVIPFPGLREGPEFLRLGRGPDGLAANWRLGRVVHQDRDRRVAWCFPTRGPVAELWPVTGHGPAMQVFNDPTFCCVSARWDGSIHDPRLDPAQYDAIHLHEDDLGPLNWPSTCVVQVPPSAESGVYAITIATIVGTEEVPFFVRPLQPRAPIAFLVPTLTYAAYADEALPVERYPWMADDRAHRFAQANGLLSLYDEHADGSGVSLKSLEHPKATLRHDYVYPLSGSPHLLPVDLQLLAFCHSQEICFDLLTDEDLHREGHCALEPYSGIFTGSHPEYWTGVMQQALQQWLDQGGNLAYLGGNGLMWVTALEANRVEVRRGQTLASRTWDGAAGESVMALSGEIGGLWRDRGRSEFSVTGVGMTMMGFGPARPYRRLPVSADEKWAWIFENVGHEPIGSEGSVLGGAAGYEVDRTDERLGTPFGTVVLACADGFGPEYQVDGNEYFPGGAAERDAARRCDMAVRQHQGGGFVFSVGSVSWCGSLPGIDATNGVGQITSNVLRRLRGGR
ncbi:MAG: N,N-dimethylformamidase beta subunit family domain-containing protein [Janthinobacterium lividum]